MLGCKQDALPKEDAIHEFFKFGSQYYVAGRYGVFAGLMPVAANLHHHAIEMFLKGALSKSMSLEELKRKLGHRLPKIWTKFKRQASDPSLNRFDKIIKELNKFEDIRYPDEILRRGAGTSWGIGCRRFGGSLKDRHRARFQNRRRRALSRCCRAR
jgi:hypothetical protein